MDYHPVHLGAGEGWQQEYKYRCFMLQNLGLTLANCELHDLCSCTLRVVNTFSQFPSISLFQLGFYCNSYLLLI